MANPYEPSPKNLDPEVAKDLGWLLTEFDPFDVNPKYGWDFNKRSAPRSLDDWKIIKPRKSPAIGDLPSLVQTLIKSTWKYTEPTNDAGSLATYQLKPMTRGIANHFSGNVVMGSRNSAPSPNASTFSPQVRPTKSVIKTTFPNDSAIATDWGVFEAVKRTNAVTFRGDGRNPYEVIIKAQGFHPPNTRTDASYQVNIYEAFAYYMDLRYKRKVSSADFTTALNKTAATDADRKLLEDYLMWRRLCDREAVHLGRMVENECLKGYISTTRSIDTTMRFATNYMKREGWIYLVIVEGGFIVPGSDKTIWGSGEAEIAQLGPITADRVVGFMKMTKTMPTGQIYIRRTFRQKEPKAFEAAFDIMSGKTPVK